MSKTYLAEKGNLVVPDESDRPLHTYHSAVEQRLDDGIELIGLTGKDNGIRRIVVSDELSESSKSDLEDYLKSEIRLVDSE